MSNQKYFDSHAHAQFAAFESDWREVIVRALEKNVWMVNVGTQRDTSRRAVDVANEFKEGVYAAVGLHPTHTGQSYHDAQELGGGEVARAFTSRGETFNHAFYKVLARDPKVVAIGECGLDYYRSPKDQNAKAKMQQLQKEVFLDHVRLANELKKPLMIHCRPSGKSDDAYEDLLSFVTSRELLVTPIFHFYVGSPAMTGKLLGLGAYFTFGGAITFARDYDESIKMIPLERILSETDAPYVAPAPYRGKRNEPVYVVEAVKKLAELKGISEEVMARAAFTNARRVFGV